MFVLAVVIGVAIMVICVLLSTALKVMVNTTSIIPLLHSILFPLRSAIPRRENMNTMALSVKLTGSDWNLPLRPVYLLILPCFVMMTGVSGFTMDFVLISK